MAVPSASSLNTAPRSLRFRAGIVILAVGMVAVVGYVDWLTSAYIAFSIFYLPAIVLAAWFMSRWAGIAVGALAAVTGLVADLAHGHVQPPFAYTNMCLRLLLFTAAASVIARLYEALQREHALSEANREAAARLQAANDLKDELMRAVVDDARGPLGNIFASAVTLRMAQRDLTSADAAELVGQIANASSNLSSLVDQLIAAGKIDPAAIGAEALEPILEARPA
jgi:signal transduction histidine kinase